MSDEDADYEIAETESDEPDNLPSKLFPADSPTEIVEQAEEYANALTNVVSEQGLVTQVQGNSHVQIEGWTLLGSMVGVYPVTEWTREIERGSSHGYEARVKAVRSDGSVVGAAEAMCMDNEVNWTDKEDYAIRSMAQTRAASKALRMPLGFIVNLAGYNPTPAEEMTGVQQQSTSTDNTNVSNSAKSTNNEQSGDMTTDPSEIVWPFGDNKGTPISEMPDGSLEWMIDEYMDAEKLSDDDYGESNRRLKRACERALAGDDGNSDDDFDASDDVNQIMELAGTVGADSDIIEQTITLYTDAESIDDYGSMDKISLREIYQHLEDIQVGDKELELDENGALDFTPF